MRHSVKPQFDVVQYYCCCELFDIAFDIYYGNIQQAEKFLLDHHLGACDADLNLFPFGSNTPLFAFTMAAYNLLVQWHGMKPDQNGFFAFLSLNSVSELTPLVS